MSVHALPSGPVVSWYGDDFTGAAAVMELLTVGGLPSVLFLNVPTPQLLERFAGFRGIGIAGTARSKSPEWMDAKLPAVFSCLDGIGAAILHYKVCSTLDSSPQVGSIGRAMEVGRRHLRAGRWMPVVVGAPAIGRYQAFGNLFAVAQGRPFRLDRHPTMSRHPITPMHESDVTLHIGDQTADRVGLIDYNMLMAGEAEHSLAMQLGDGIGIIAIDVMDRASLIAAGKLIWEHRDTISMAVGSQGLEYALLAYWQDEGIFESTGTEAVVRPYSRIAAVSGSCSPETHAQIMWATENGFEPIRLDAARVVDTRSWQGALADATTTALEAMGQGRDPLIFTSLGPDDPALQRVRYASDAIGSDPASISAEIGRGLGAVLARIRAETDVRRFAIAGGDTSGNAMQALGVEALTLASPMTPAVALFDAHPPSLDGETFEVSLKGGQMGTVDYFGIVRSGTNTSK